MREVELQRLLRHPNIVEFHSFFEDDENVYITMENCNRKVKTHDFNIPMLPIILVKVHPKERNQTKLKSDLRILIIYPEKGTCIVKSKPIGLAFGCSWDKKKTQSTGQLLIQGLPRNSNQKLNPHTGLETGQEQKRKCRHMTHV